MTNDEEALKQHLKLRGKIGLDLKDNLDSGHKMSLYYTPGVAAVSREIAKNPETAKDYTWLNNCVAVISDGSAVLGLGDIGPYGSLPVMEGKCMLFKHFAGIDAVPIILDVHEAEEIVQTVKAIAPSFGGINLEDINAPKCFEFEERLKKELSIPVMHDDQHGTAVVTLAGLINATKLTRRDLNDCKIVISGVGAAGVAIIKILKLYSPKARVYAVDSKGIIKNDRSNLNSTKQKLLDDKLIESDASGTIKDAVIKADIFIGVSQPNLLSQDMVKTMAKKPIIFAMSNPNPEIMPEEAKTAGAAVIATGRSDFPNQVNNAIAFPGIFRGALDHNVRDITDQHKIAAAEAIASLVKNPSFDNIIPSVQEKRLVPTIAEVIV